MDPMEQKYSEEKKPSTDMKDYVIDEPMHYVDEPTYGEKKKSDMDYVIDEPMKYVDEPMHYVIDEPTYLEEKHSDDMQFKKQPLKTTGSEGKPNPRVIEEKKEAAKAEEARRGYGIQKEASEKD